METLRKQLYAECGYRMKSETMEAFLEMMCELKLRRNQSLISYAECDTSLYVVKEGIVRSAYFDGFKEMTYAFYPPGSIIISYYAFCEGRPSFSKYEACCDSVVMKIPKANFVELASRSLDFAQWMMYMSLMQLYGFERKREVINGDAKERFESLVENRPEILEKVSSRNVASYIGVTPVYLSKLKRDLMNGPKK